jgi:hypothetical protein
VLRDCPAEADLRITVLANGCRDNTADVIRRVAEEHPEVKLVEIVKGDKCNAWNHYVHDLAGEADVHFFMDGDCQVAPGSIRRMCELLTKNPTAQACAGFALSGRSRETLARYVREYHWLFGGLYAVSGQHLARIQDCNVRLPLGLKGNDDIISRVMRTLLPDMDAQDEERVIHDPEEKAGFLFDPIRPYCLDDIRMYFRRMATYRLRWHQLQVLFYVPLSKFPRTMDGINRDILRMLEMTPWYRLGFTDRAVRRNLRKLYPGEVNHYENLFPQPPFSKAAPGELAAVGTAPTRQSA